MIMIIDNDNNDLMIIIKNDIITNTEFFAFITVLVFTLLSRKVLFINRKDNRNLKSRLPFKKIASVTGKLLQTYKKLEYKIFRILLEHVSNHSSVLFQFA